MQDITAYCAYGSSKTASGKTPRPGMVATLDRTIKFGTVVRIRGLGTYVVEDRIGRGSSFDVFLGGPNCEARARDFGRQHRVVDIAA